MSEQSNFTDKKVLITGSSRGIGRATARLFAQAGAKVAVHYQNKAEAAYETLEQLHGQGHAMLQADLAQPEQVRQLVQQAHQQLGGLDVLVNNAGIFVPHPVDQMPYEEWLATWQQTISVNLTGAAIASYTAAEFMRAAGGGKIVNVGSRGAFRGEAGQPAYGASKAGLHALSQSLAQALGPYGITVHAVAPGFVETAMARPWLQGEAGEAVKAQSPLNRVATVEDVANAILYLASPAAEFTTGCILDINGASYLRT
ncbi:MAG: SDR family oxidoreductase [Lewinella sp.]|nr:SDR family oxidoreductase [Lewinella sp.]